MAPRKCPKCGSRSVARLIYGLVRIEGELERKLDSGEVALGGCCIEDDMPRLRCNDCLYAW